jgi:tetratricopeptide (TPR) repeat protein
MLERYRSSGPRGMAMVPLAQKHLLEDLELHEANLYDGLYQVQQALYAHDRAQADEVIHAMVRTTENHRLTHQAQLAVAEYDCDEARVLVYLEKLLTLFPDDANRWLYKLSVLRRMARRDERLELLKSLCHGKQKHPLFWQMYAAELSDDGREQARVLKWLRRALRYGPADAHNYYLLANHLWSQQRFAEAKELYRFAACLRDTNEDYVRAYFSASQYFHEQPLAIRFLTNRFQRFGRRSHFPARTLAWAYEQIGQEPSALATLKEGLEQRPDDADLMLYAADVFARVGQFDEAGHWLQQAESEARRVDWLQASAIIAAYRGDVKSALAMWQQVAEAEPFNFTATRNVAQALAETKGEAAAIAFLRERVARFPHNLALHRLLVEWLRNHPAENEQAARAMIDVDPIDAWAHRELALALAVKQDYQQAVAEAELAQKLEPTHPDCYNVLARIHTATGNIDGARAAYRRAINLSVDNDHAIANLMAISHSPAERRGALQFIKEELIRQVTFGGGLLAYREYARATLEDKELHELLQDALAARPDLWHAWSAMTLQLIDMQQYDEALNLANRAVERFPLVPRIWFDLSLVHQARLDRQGEMEALEKALEINPSWGNAARQLAEAYVNLGELQKARAMLEQAVARAPLDCANYGCLAALLWRLGEKEHAIERLKRAVTIEPGYDWAWGSLRAWSRELEREDEIVALVRDMAERRSGEARSWLLLAETLQRPEQLPERLRALDRAHELNPRLVEAHVLRARLLADASRFDEARAACHPEIFNGDLPLPLRNAAAMVEAESGNLEQAIEKMRAVVAEEPNNYEGWCRLADWTGRDPTRKEEYLKAATELVRIAPNYSVSLGYLGAARKLNGDRPGAKEAFKHALALAPDYDFGGFNLFDLQLEDGEIQAAKETLTVLKQHIGGDWVALGELELAVKEKDAQTATHLLRHLCQETGAERRLLDSAVKTMDENQMDRQVDDVLDQSLDVPTANPTVGEVWANRWIERREYEHCRRHLESCSEKTAAWYRAAAHYLYQATEDMRMIAVDKFIRNTAAELRSNNETWGLVGHALYELHHYSEVVKWISDWRSRNPQPWVLLNYVLALRHLNRDAEAYQISREALQLPPDDLSDAHRVLLALDDALAGRCDPAAEQLQQVHYDALRPWDKVGYDTASAIVQAARSPQSAMKQLSKLAGLRQANPSFWKDKLLFKAHWRATLKIAESTKNRLVKLWAYLLLRGLYFKRAFVVWEPKFLRSGLIRVPV